MMNRRELLFGAASAFAVTPWLPETAYAYQTAQGIKSLGPMKSHHAVEQIREYTLETDFMEFDISDEFFEQNQTMGEIYQQIADNCVVVINGEIEENIEQVNCLEKHAMTKVLFGGMARGWANADIQILFKSKFHKFRFEITVEKLPTKFAFVDREKSNIPELRQKLEDLYSPLAKLKEVNDIKFS